MLAVALLLLLPMAAESNYQQGDMRFSCGADTCLIKCPGHAIALQVTSHRHTEHDPRCGGLGFNPLRGRWRSYPDLHPAHFYSFPHPHVPRAIGLLDQSDLSDWRLYCAEHERALLEANQQKHQNATKTIQATGKLLAYDDELLHFRQVLQNMHNDYVSIFAKLKIHASNVALQFGFAKTLISEEKRYLAALLPSSMLRDYRLARRLEGQWALLPDFKQRTEDFQRQLIDLHKRLQAQADALLKLPPVVDAANAPEMRRMPLRGELAALLRTRAEGLLRGVAPLQRLADAQGRLQALAVASIPPLASRARLAAALTADAAPPQAAAQPDWQSLAGTLLREDVTQSYRAAADRLLANELSPRRALHVLEQAAAALRRSYAQLFTLQQLTVITEAITRRLSFAHQELVAHMAEMEHAVLEDLPRLVAQRRALARGWLDAEQPGCTASEDERARVLGGDAGLEDMPASLADEEASETAFAAIQQRCAP